MTSNWENVRLGDLLTPVRRSISAVASEEYKLVTLPLYGKGARLRKIVRGSELGTARYRVHTGDLMISKIDARKGSNSLLPPELNGAVVTGDFLSYEVDSEIATIEFMDLVAKSVWFADLCDSVSSGTTNRVRLDVRRFLALPVSLPALVVQRRIVDLIGALDEAIEAADATHDRLIAASSSARNQTFQQLVQDHAGAPAGDIFEIKLGRQKSVRQLHGDYEIPYLRAANISHGELSLSDVQTMNFEPHEQAQYNLRHGDVLVVEGGSIGQTALWEGQIDGPVGFDKHVLRLRGRNGISNALFALQWAQWCYESGQFQEQARGVTIKALGLQRAKNMPVPVISLERQLEVVNALSSLDDTKSAAKVHAASLRNLRSEILNSLLSGAHTIPESYDELLEVVVA